jgi:Flp pilus assembly protein TadD
MSKKTSVEYVSEALDLYAAGRLHESVALYQKAIEAEDAVVEAHLGLAKAYEIMGALDEAIEVLHHAAELHPAEPFVHTSLSQCLQKKGMIPEAEEEMAIAMQLSRMAMR